MERGAVQGTSWPATCLYELLDEMLYSRQDVARHELYHFLGCGHSYTMMVGRYKHIHAIKATYRDLKNCGYYEQMGEKPFFPTCSLKKKDTLLTTRQEVNQALEESVQ